jgi:hypothetical protein
MEYVGFVAGDGAGERNLLPPGHTHDWQIPWNHAVGHLVTFRHERGRWLAVQIEDVFVRRVEFDKRSYKAFRVRLETTGLGMGQKSSVETNLQGILKGTRSLARSII